MLLLLSTVTGADHPLPLNVTTRSAALAMQNLGVAHDTAPNTAPASTVTGADQVVPL